MQKIQFETFKRFCPRFIFLIHEIRILSTTPIKIPKKEQVACADRPDA